MGRQDDGERPRRPELDGAVLSGLGAQSRQDLERLCALLWSDAGMVDRAETLPTAHLEGFMAAGLYGIMAPVEEGGLGLGYPEMCAVVEELASACVTTTFVWAQHFRFLAAMLAPTTPAVWRQRWRAPAIAGTTKGGIALTGLMPGPPRLTAAPVGEGWVVQGQAPWVSGWDIIDELVVVARGPDDTVVSFVMDAQSQPGLTVVPARLSAMNASRTVRLQFERLHLDGDRALVQEPYAVSRQQPERLRLNGSFALGVAKSCCLLIGPSALDDELRSCRAELDTSSDAAMPEARAAACELAVRAAHALAVSRGSGSALVGDIAERLSREAAVLLVFGSRPTIKDALLERLHASAHGG